MTTAATDLGRKPLVAATMGDPAGIGPDVLLLAITHGQRDLLLLADPDLLAGRAAVLGLELDLVAVESGDEARDLLAEGQPGPWCLRTTVVTPGLRAGTPRLDDGASALACIEAGAALAASGTIDGLVTAPVSKDHIARHDPAFLGHTEYLARRARAEHPTMLFAAPRSTGEPPGADVALLSTHLPLGTALSLIRTDIVAAMLERVSGQWAQTFGRAPVIGLAAVNPHAGEAGRIGTEESRVLAPAMAVARDRGVTVRGPYPADSVFLRPGLDVILALYHDQGTIMAKRAPWPTVNLTLGLPYARTSPDHGTAYELAGTGRCDPAAMIAAIQLAASLATCRRDTGGLDSAKDAANGC